MNAVVIYSSKYGTTKTCAEKIAQGLNNANLADIKKIKGIDLSAYDTVIIGSSIRMGQINKKIKIFCEHNTEELIKKNLGLFICSGMEENVNKDFNVNFEKKLLQNCTYKSWLGGEIDLKKARGIDKIIVGMVVKMFENDGHKTYPKINEKNIEEFIKIMSNN